MRLKHIFIYFICSMFLEVIFGIIDYFYIREILNIFSQEYNIHILAMAICLLIINPIIIYFIINKIPIKPKLRLNGNIDVDIKKQK